MRAKRLVISVPLIFIGVAVVVLFFEKAFIYFPHRELALTPSALGLVFEDISLTAADGMRLHGWYFPRPQSRICILFCHGNAGNISHRLDRVLLMRSKLQAEVFLFDYRGYGRSQGHPDEEGTYRDGRAAIELLIDERRIPPERIILFGESLGAAVAMQLSLEYPARALVLESAFTSIPDMARAVYPFLPVSRFLRTRYDNLAKISNCGKPLLLFHGTRDRIVPFDQGRRLFEAAQEPKRLFPIEGAGHNDTFFVGGDPYWEAWREFLKQSSVISQQSSDRTRGRPEGRDW
jgi:fermentation-respiration switch protein FrsA (DUF1100 family)